MKIPYDGHVPLKEGCTGNIKILLIGDLCPTADVERNFIQVRGEEGLWGDVLPQLLGKDVSITNLKLALTCGRETIDKG